MGQGGERVVVVSNRPPVTLLRAGEGWKMESSAGGLATAMNPILKQTNGIWIGWPGPTRARFTLPDSSLGRALPVRFAAPDR